MSGYVPNYIKRAKTAQKYFPWRAKIKDERAAQKGVASAPRIPFIYMTTMQQTQQVLLKGKRVTAGF